MRPEKAFAPPLVEGLFERSDGSLLYRQKASLPLQLPARMFKAEIEGGRSQSKPRGPVPAPTIISLSSLGGLSTARFVARKKQLQLKTSFAKGKYKGRLVDLARQGGQLWIEYDISAMTNWTVRLLAEDSRRSSSAKTACYSRVRR